jgi:hypothetical protein
MSSWSWTAGLAGTAIVAATAYALAQMPGHQGMHGPMGQGTGQAMGQPPSPDGRMPGPMQGQQMMGMMYGQQGMHGAMGGHRMRMGGQAGAAQAAFGAIQDVVQTLEADPTTDWSKVNIGALRQHLIDMDEVTLRAAANERPLDSGIEIAVTGEGRTLEAIKRMVPAHVQELARTGWNAKTEDLPNGVRLTVTSTDPKQVVKLKALGFMGIMVQGEHHQPHHLLMAKGELHEH